MGTVDHLLVFLFPRLLSRDHKFVRPPDLPFLPPLGVIHRISRIFFFFGFKSAPCMAGDLTVEGRFPRLFFFIPCLRAPTYS